MDGSIRDSPGAPRWRAVAAILILYLAYAAIFIWRSSDVIDGVRYFSLHEDAMISMRYARNLAAGNGFRWNPGEPAVEGITNPLWTGVMAVVQLLPVSRAHASAWVQAIGLVCGLASIVLASRIASLLSGGSSAAAVLAALLTAFSLPLNEWSLLGMEVGPLAAWTAWLVWRALRGFQGGRGWLWTYACLGLGTFIRLDFAVTAAVLLATSAWVDRPRRVRHLAIGGGILGLFLVAQTGARWLYFGDVLPNTFYLKMTGYPVLLRVTRGLLVFVEWCWRSNALLLAVPCGLLFVRRDPRIALPAAVVAGQCAYSIWVGGDAWEWWGGANRFVAVALPLLFALFATGAAPLGVWAAPSLKTSPRVVTVFVGAAALVLFNAVSGPRAMGEWALLHRPVFSMLNAQKIEIAHVLERVTAPDAVVGVAWAGSVAYFTDRTMVDLLGKSDRRIGKAPMHLPPASMGIERLWFFAPGHLKWDYAYGIGERAPDAVATLWHPEDALPYLDRHYREVSVAGMRVFFRNDSRRVHWERIPRPNQ